MGGGARVNGSRASAGFDRRRVTLRWRATFASPSDAVPRIVARIVAAARKAGFLGQGRTDFEIALHEAIANAVLHGNRADASRHVRVRLYGQPGYGVVVAVRDEGAGFDPTSVPDPRSQDRIQLQHGRGLFLVRQLTDYVEHRKHGREIVFHKCIRERED
jgi:serine/threonine-protein kinase RsbW